MYGHCIISARKQCNNQVGVYKDVLAKCKNLPKDDTLQAVLEKMREEQAKNNGKRIANRKRYYDAIALGKLTNGYKSIMMERYLF